MNKAQINNKNMTYLFKLAPVSEARHATPPPGLRQPMAARRTWRAFFAMTSSLLWDDVKFKMDGITTSAKKPVQHARKVAAVWWKKGSLRTTERARWWVRRTPRKAFSPAAWALNRLGSWRHLAKCEEKSSFFPFPAWRNSERAILFCHEARPARACASFKAIYRGGKGHIGTLYRPKN